jgi:THO complex subunit 2
MGKGGLDSKANELAEAEEQQLMAAKGFLKRLAKENVKSVGRLIGRHTHSFPLIVFAHILNQIEHYENLIPYVVDALKYSTLLTKDVLAYALLTHLGKGGNREKLKQGDTHYSQWFASLAKFAASFYRRYCNNSH